MRSLVSPRVFEYENHMKRALWTQVDALCLNEEARGKNRIPSDASANSFIVRAGQ